MPGRLKNQDGSWSSVDRSHELIKRIEELSIDAVISIGGDGSQKISQKLFEIGCQRYWSAKDHRQ